MSRSNLRTSERNALRLVSWLLTVITVTITFLVSAPVSAQAIINNPTYVCPAGESACTVRPQWSETGYSVSATTDQSIRLELPSNPEAQATGNGNFGINLGVALGGGFVNSDGPSHGDGAVVLGGHYTLGRQWSLVGDAGIGASYSATTEDVRFSVSELVGFGREITDTFQLNFGVRHRIVFETDHDAMNALLGELQADFTVGERFHVVPSLGIGNAWFPGRKAGSSNEVFTPAPGTGGAVSDSNNEDVATESYVASGLVIAAGINFMYSF